MNGRFPYRAALLAGLLLHAPVAAPAEAGDCRRDAGLAAAGKVVSLDREGTLVLEDGQAVRLSAVAVPTGSGGHGEKAHAALRELLLGRAVALAHVGRQDRYARLPAQVFVGGRGAAIWVQEWLVDRGLARVRSFRDDRACAAALLAREAVARKARLGLWASPDFAVRAAGAPETLSLLLDTFQIVEGEVVSIGAAGRQVYLNFGRRWKTDFTAVIAARDLDMFAAAGISPLKLPQRRVRLRGWLSRHDGPMMVLDHPEQIELIDNGDRND